MTRNKTVYQATVSPTIIFAVFYVCWIEDAVCSEIQDENTAGCHNVTQNTSIY